MGPQNIKNHEDQHQQRIYYSSGSSQDKNDPNQENESTIQPDHHKTRTTQIKNTNLPLNQIDPSKNNLELQTSSKEHQNQKLHLYTTTSTETRSHSA